MAFEDGCIVTFYDEPMLNKSKTKRNTGIPIYDDITMVKILIPNQHDCAPRPMQEKDKARFPKSWQAYETGREPAEDGTPLADWAQITPGEMKTCLANNVKTVEMLAEVADQTLPTLGPGAVSLRQRAVKFLADRNEMPALREELDELRAELAELKASKKKAPKKKMRVVAGS